MIDAPSRAMTQPPHAAGLRCERPGCGGPLLWQREDKRDWLAECVKCGQLQSWEHIQAPRQPQTEGGTPSLLRERESLTLYIDTDPSLVAGILDTLHRILAADREMDAARSKQRAEAERLHAALTAYGVPDLPEIPWRGGPGSTVGKRKQCAQCRVEKHPTSGSYVGGTWYCRTCQRNGIHPLEAAS